MSNMATELPEHDGVWLSITELAKFRGVGKSTISEKVADLVAAGLVQTKPAPRGRGKLVHLASFLRATNATGDASKELVAAIKAPPADDGDDASPRDSSYRLEQERAKRLEADMRELDLAERRGDLVSIKRLASVAESVAGKIVAAIEQLPSHAEDMAAAVARDGTAGARMQYRANVRELRSAIAELLPELLELAPESESPDLLPSIEGETCSA